MCGSVSGAITVDVGKFNRNEKYQSFHSVRFDDNQLIIRVIFRKIRNKNHHPKIRLRNDWKILDKSETLSAASYLLLLYYFCCIELLRNWKKKVQTINNTPHYGDTEGDIVIFVGIEWHIHLPFYEMFSFAFDQVEKK